MVFEYCIIKNIAIYQIITPFIEVSSIIKPAS